MLACAKLTSEYREHKNVAAIVDEIILKLLPNILTFPFNQSDLHIKMSIFCYT